MTNHALAPSEALRLLRGVPLGRIAFTIDALPTIRPTHHMVDDGVVIVRGHRGVEVVLKEAANKVVAYSADVIDPHTYVGWCVTLTGMAQLIDSPPDLARFPSVIRPWGTHEQGYVIRIEPEVVTGFELLERPDERSASAS